MGVNLSMPAAKKKTTSKDEVAVSQSIDRTMRMAREEEQSQIKLLLLGSENSGKSTVMKQFQIIHKMGFSAEERKVFRDQLWKSAIDSMRALVRMREDYISTHNLGTGEEHFGVNLAALDPYLQFLLCRVQSDQELFEEVNVPVAARAMATPRASSDFAQIAGTPTTVQQLDVIKEEKQRQRSSKRARHRRRFASFEEELHYHRAKYNSRVHTTVRTFATEEEELDFYFDRIARKRERAKRAAQPTTPTPPVTTTVPKLDSFTDSMDSSGTNTANGGNASTNIHQVKWDKLSIGRLLQKVWMDPVIQLCFQLEEQNPILDAPLGYIMKEMDRICEPGFQPTNDDVLNCRKRTAGATFLKFEAYDTRFLLIDVGGQKAERKRWILNFDNADVVIFVVGLDQYDQVDLQDGENKLKDAIELFRDMCKSPWLCTSSFLLFLNKNDIFKTKIRQVPFNTSPYLKKDYKGDPHDHEQCTKFIIKKFQQIHAEWYQVEKERRKSINSAAAAAAAGSNGGGSGKQSRKTSTVLTSSSTASSRDLISQNQVHFDNQIPQMYWYVTCATDTESMKFIIHMCRDIFLKKEMAKFGFTDV